MRARLLFKLLFERTPPFVFRNYCCHFIAAVSAMNIPKMMSVGGVFKKYGSYCCSDCYLHKRLPGVRIIRII